MGVIDIQGNTKRVPLDVTTIVAEKYSQAIKKNFKAQKMCKIVANDRLMLHIQKKAITKKPQKAATSADVKSGETQRRLSKGGNPRDRRADHSQDASNTKPNEATSDSMPAVV